VTNRNKDAGSKYEADVVAYLRNHGHPYAARTLAGSREDRGDISGVHLFDMPVALQCKRERKLNLSGNLDETVEQAHNLGTSWFFLIQKRWGRSDIGESYTVTNLATLAEMLRVQGQLLRSTYER